MERSSPLGRHCLAREPVTIAIRSQLEGRVRKPFRFCAGKKILGSSDIGELSAEESEVRREVAPGEPEPGDLDEPVRVAAGVERVLERELGPRPVMPVKRSLGPEYVVPACAHLAELE